MSNDGPLVDADRAKVSFARLAACLARQPDEPAAPGHGMIDAEMAETSTFKREISGLQNQAHRGHSTSFEEAHFRRP
jgi:hypothetical protein